MTDFSQGISIHPGTQSLITFSKKVITQLPYPYSECNFRPNNEIDEAFIKKNNNQISKFIQAFKHLNKTYTHNDCHNFCFQQGIIMNCGCYNPAYYSFSHTTPCLNKSQIQCQIRLWTIKRYDVTFDKCVKSCPLECERVLYDYQVSSSEFPSKSIYENWLRNIPSVQEYVVSNRSTYESIKNNFLYLIFNFKDLSYESVEELENMTFIDLISNIGILRFFFSLLIWFSIL